MSIGVPIKLMHEAESHIITVELKTGEVYHSPLLVKQHMLTEFETALQRTIG